MPAYFSPSVAELPSKPTNCRPRQDVLRLVKAKFPAASDLVWPEHPVGLPASSTPSIVIMIPGIGVSLLSLSTVRPIRDVVAVCTARLTLADCVVEMPSTVAEAEIVKVALPTAWPAGAVTVRIELCPAVICGGVNCVVTPVGTPVTLKLASWLKPLLLLKVTEYAVLVPCCTVAEDGPAATVKLLDATTLKLAVDVAD